jgi:hypothetical protein
MQPTSPSVRPVDVAAGKADGELLMESLLPFAEEMLRKHREFFPFGGSMKHDGEIVHEGAYNGTEQPPSQELIHMLRQAHQQAAREQRLRACVTIYDIRTVPPGRSVNQDAIAAAIDHIGGYSGVVIFPYSFDSSGDLCIEAPFAVQGDRAIFPDP